MQIMTRPVTLIASLALLTVLSACSSGQPDPSASVTPESATDSTAIASASPSNDTKSFIAGRSYRRDTSHPGDTTVVGEPVLDAEQRFVDYAIKRIKTDKSSDEILEAGYKICHLYREEGTVDGVGKRITAESSNAEEGEILWMSGAAAKVLCPEYKDVK